MTWWSWAGLYSLGVGCLAVAACGGVSTGSGMVLGYSPIRGIQVPTPRTSLPETLAPQVNPQPTPNQAGSRPPPFLTALDRASHHHERAVAELRRGNANGAEEEFSAAAVLLLDPAAVTPIRIGFRSPRPALPLEMPPWRDQPGDASSESGGEMEEGDEAEPLPSAPALVTPEDVKAIEQGARGTKGGPATAVDGQRYDVPIVVNEKVQVFLDYFSTRRYDLITRAFERASRYLPMMREIFREKGVPQDLLNLAFIESAFNPRARSRAGATGIWQFVPSTGRRFGMRSGVWVDERRDPERSTRGAAEYLKTLYILFQDWPLALAAYNAGEGKVQQAINRQRTTDFWKLRLPKETTLFVPAFMAMTIIAKDPAKYGFAPPPEQLPETATVPVRESVDLRAIAKAAQTSPETVRHLNPTLVRGATPPEPFTLRLPAENAEGFLDRLAQIPRPQRPALAQHQVKKGETWRSLARRYRVPVTALLELNGKDTAGPLKVGSMVLLPARGGAGRAIAQASGGEGAGERAQAGGRRAGPQQYTVRRGDTLGKIARAHRVPLEDLRRWNNLTAQAPLKPGQLLLLQNPQAAAAPPPGAERAGASRAARAPAAVSETSPASPKGGGPRGRPRTIRYTVKPGDSLWTIAQAHGVHLEELKRWNGIKRRRNLQPGQELQIILPEPS